MPPPTDYNKRRCDRGETDIIRASEALVSGSIPDGRTNDNQALDDKGFFVSGLTELPNSRDDVRRLSRHNGNSATGTR